MSNDKIQSVELASNIIDTVGNMEGASLPEIASELDLPRSTAHIHLKTLVDIGYINRRNGEYHLGLSLIEKGGEAIQKNEIYSTAKPEIERLAHLTQDRSCVGIDYRSTRLLLYKSEGIESIGSFYEDVDPIGCRTPLNWTALGKAILASKSDDEIQEYLEMESLPEATEDTITDSEVLLEEIDRIRERGYSIEDEEHFRNIRAVAVPIQNKNYADTAISVSGTKHRLSDNRIEDEVLDPLFETVDRIEIALENNR